MQSSVWYLKQTKYLRVGLHADLRELLGELDPRISRNSGLLVLSILGGDGSKFVEFEDLDPIYQEESSSDHTVIY